MNRDPHSQSVRRIVLPSGRAIEVVRFHRQSAPSELEVCPDCASHLVQPFEWREATQGYWQLVLGCPNCHWFNEGVFSQEQVDDFEEQLDQGLAAMLDDLRRLTHANMSEEIDRFAAALDKDLILPEDF
jgi:hypothetical protein